MEMEAQKKMKENNFILKTYDWYYLHLPVIDFHLPVITIHFHTHALDLFLIAISFNFLSLN